jgi:hypothetical protein
MDGQNLLSERQFAAILLILCGLVLIVPITLYVGKGIWQWPAAQTDLYLRWERGLVVTAFLINVMGVVLLEGLLREAGDTLIARPALAIYLIAGTVLVVAEMAYLNNREWVYPQIVLHIILAFLAQAAFGVALLRTGLVASWAGWATVIWNLAWLVILPIFSPRDIYYPVLHHAAPLMIGIALLVR